MKTKYLIIVFLSLFVAACFEKSGKDVALEYEEKMSKYLEQDNAAASLLLQGMFGGGDPILSELKEKYKDRFLDEKFVQEFNFAVGEVSERLGKKYAGKFLMGLFGAATDNSKSNNEKPSQNNSNNIEELKKSANKYLDEKNYNSAIDDFTKVLAIDSKNSESYHNRGLANFRLQNYSSALKDMNEAIELNPLPQSYDIRGRINLELKEYQNALNDFTSILKIREDKMAYYHRSFAKVGLNMKEDALKDLELSLKIDPNYKESLEAKKYILSLIR